MASEQETARRLQAEAQVERREQVIVTETVTLKMRVDQARALRRILRHVGGSGPVRRHCDELEAALAAAGVVEAFERPARSMFFESLS